MLPALPDLVGDHSFDLGGVRIAHQSAQVQLALGLRVLRSEDMAHESVTALNFAGAGLLETLLCPRMGL